MPFTMPTTLPVPESAPSALDFSAKAEGAVITGCRPDVTRVTVPEAVDGMPVVGVAEDAFRGHPHLLCVTLPDSVQTIGQGAFRDCPALMRVSAGSGLAEVAAQAFHGCVSLQEVHFPSRPLAAQDAFAACYQLEAAREPVIYR